MYYLLEKNGQMYRKIMKVFLSLLLLFHISLFSTEENMHVLAPNQAAEIVDVGAYIMNIYDIDWHSETINIDFWVWFRYQSTAKELEAEFDVIPSTKFKMIASELTSLPNGEKILSVKYRARVLASWNFSGFPLEQLSLTVGVEPLSIFYDQLQFGLMKTPVKINDKIRLFDWKIASISAEIKKHEYNTDFGVPNFDGEGSKFSQFSIHVGFARKGLRLFFQIFSVLYLSYFLSLASFFIPITELNSKIGLMIGSIFALIGNDFVIQAMFPPVGQFTLVDKIEILIFGCIIFAIIIMLITRYFFRKSWKTTGRVVDILCGLASLAVFITVNWILIKGVIASQ